MDNNRELMEEDTIDLLELVKVLLHRWKPILCIILSTIAGCVRFFYYTTETKYS